MYYSNDLEKVFLVYGRIGAEWASWNWEKGRLGLPVADPVNFAGGASQRFAGGKIYWSSKTDAHAIYGMVLEEFERGSIEKWGFPLKAEGDTQDMRGRYQNFEFGTLYYKWGDDKAYGVKDDILSAYKLLGYEVGKLGFPQSDEKSVLSTSVRQSFENGYIQVDLITKNVEIMIDGEVMS